MRSENISVTHIKENIVFLRSDKDFIKTHI